MDFMVHIVNGQITNKKTVKNQFESLEDGAYIVNIKSKKNRSILQNRFWWGALIPLVKLGLNEAGYNEVKTNEDAHEVLKALFLKKHISNENGEALEMCGTTTELSTVEFNMLIEKVQQWAAEFLNIDIPSPNEKLVLFN